MQTSVRYTHSICRIIKRKREEKEKWKKRLMTDSPMTGQAKHQPMRALNGQLCNYAAKDGRPCPTHDHFILTTLR